MKIKTTRYDHKVNDLVHFQYGTERPTEGEIYTLFIDLANNLVDSIASGKGGSVRIQVSRPLSKADVEHRMGVVQKNIEKERGYQNYWAARKLEDDRQTYERLRKQFEGE